jgi:hypothetical protein
MWHCLRFLVELASLTEVKDVNDKIWWVTALSTYVGPAIPQLIAWFRQPSESDPADVFTVN